MRTIVIIITLIWGTLIFGHGKEKHEPKIIDDNKIDTNNSSITDKKDNEHDKKEEKSNDRDDLSIEKDNKN
mgnify:CR=1 FL=1